MIFDSDLMAELHLKHVDVPLYEVPRIVRLARRSDLAAERDYLEATLQCATGAKRRKWFAELVTEDDGQHYGTWFEMMLYGWLQQVGRVEIEPVVQGDKPDFAVTVGGEPIMVEAEALTMGMKERMREKYVCELVSLLEASPEPYEVHILEVDNRTLGPDQELADNMLQALGQASMTAESRPLGDGAQDADGDRERYYRLSCTDTHGSEVTFIGRRKEGLLEVQACPAGVGFMDSSRVWSKLLMKVGQHEALRKAGYPYIIAMLLDVEAMMLDADAVAEALFGRPGAVIDQSAGRFVDWEWDRSGLLFLDRGRDIRHLDISGALVFEAWPNWPARRRELKARYIQNPYAAVPVEACLFPAHDRLIVLHQGAGGFRMGWASQRGPGFWLPPKADERHSTGQAQRLC